MTATMAVVIIIIVVVALPLARLLFLVLHALLYDHAFVHRMPGPLADATDGAAHRGIAALIKIAQAVNEAPTIKLTAFFSATCRISLN